MGKRFVAVPLATVFVLNVFPIGHADPNKEAAIESRTLVYHQQHTPHEYFSTEHMPRAEAVLTTSIETSAGVPDYVLIDRAMLSKVSDYYCLD